MDIQLLLGNMRGYSATIGELVDTQLVLSQMINEELWNEDSLYKCCVHYFKFYFIPNIIHILFLAITIFRHLEMHLC